VKFTCECSFHCSLMKPAEIKMADYLNKVKINNLKIPVFNNVDAKKELSAGEVKDALIRQVSNPVRWTALIKNMINDGADTFIEVGAGNVLSGLIKKIDKMLNVIIYLTLLIYLH